MESSDAGPLVEVTQAPEFDEAADLMLALFVSNGIEATQYQESPLLAETPSESLLTLGVMLRV